MIRIIGFDADDTLWHNENIFDRAQERYRGLLAKYHPADAVNRALFATEMRNLPHYGYGIKGFMLSAVETAIALTDGAVSAAEIRAIIALGQEMLAHPVEVLPGVGAAVAQLAADHRLLVITKGDLRDQERKMAASGLAAHFFAVEILSEKDQAAYARVLARHGVAPAEFAMVGNSVKSDILPVLALGAAGVHIPYHLTWQHERAGETPCDHPRFRAVADIGQLAAAVAAL